MSDIRRIGEIGKAERGVTRMSLSEADVAAREFVMGRMRELGMKVRVDEVGNIIGRLDSERPDLPAVAAGSHIDTVVQGGLFDGVYGVTGGLEAVGVLRSSGVKLKHPLELICFSNEEGARYIPLLGSKAMAGAVEAGTILSMKDSQGVTYGERMKTLIKRPDELAPSKRPRSDLKAFIELHVEQGPVLEREGYRVGVVDMVYGTLRMLVTVEGRADHAGGTPMDSRKDALVGASKIVLALNEMASRTEDFVATVGKMSVYPGAFNVVPGRVEFGVDVRTNKTDRLRWAKTRVEEITAASCDPLGLGYSTKEVTFVEPVRFSSAVFEATSSAVKALGLKSRVISSKAGHDAQIMSQITDAGMIFVPSEEGRSHSPDEWTDEADLENGASVLANSLAKLAGGNA